MSSESATTPFKFFGGRVCLDFANSLNWRLTESPVELMPDYARLLAWSVSRGTLPRRAVAALGRRAAIDHAAAEALMKEVRHLRAEVIGLAEALKDGCPPVLAAINRALASLPPQPKLIEEDGRIVFDLDGSVLEQPLWPILWSVTAVLASSDAGRIGACLARGCGWFFVDESPNHSRHWCSDGCGNRERVRRASAKRGRSTAPPEPSLRL